jgi:hypothetical protein
MEQCEPCNDLDLETEWRELDALPAVNYVRHDVINEQAHQQRATGRVICTLWCSASHPPGDLRRVINQVVIFATDAADMIERPTVEPTYSTIVGQKKSFAYMPIRPGVMASRCSSHWCEACMRARGPGNGMTAGLRVDGCTGPERRWTEHHVERTDAAGVANERKRAQALGHKLARKLKVGDWVAVQARERWSTKEVVHYRAGTPAPLPARALC